MANCNKCRTKLTDINLFPYHNKQRTGNNNYYICKNCYKEKQKGINQKTKYLRKRANKEWIEKNKDRRDKYMDELRKSDVRYNYIKSASGIYSYIKCRTNTKGYEHIPLLITRDDFVEWYNQQPRKCVYCDIQEQNIDLIECNLKAYRLTVDRKNSDEGYSIDNIVLACMLCNMIKGNTFTYEEMKEIGEKYIKPKWTKNLK